MKIIALSLFAQKLYAGFQNCSFLLLSMTMSSFAVDITC